MFRHRSILITTICALGYALGAFLIHLRWFPIGDVGVESDFYAELVVSARRLSEGQFSVANYPFKGPLYSFLLVIVHFFTEPLGADWYQGAVLFNSLCAAAIIVVLFSLMRQLFSLSLAVMVTLGTALSAEFFLQAQKASSDLLYLLLFMITASILSRSQGVKNIFMAGIMAGLAFLTRYSGGILLVGGLGVIVWLLRAENLRNRSLAIGTFILGFLLVSTPWFTVNLWTNGSFLNDGNLMNVTTDFYGGAMAGQIPLGGFNSLGHMIAHDPVYFVSHFLANIPGHIKLDMEQLLGQWLWLLVMAGTAGILVSFVPKYKDHSFFLARRPDQRQKAFLFMVASSLLVTGLVFYRPRFSLPLLPAYFTLGYGGLLGFGAISRLHGRKYLATVVVACLLVAGVTLIQLSNIVQGERYYRAHIPLFVLDQAPRVRELAEQTLARSLLARKPHLAYYADLEPVAFPQKISTWDSFLIFLKESDAQLVAVGDQERAIPGETLILDYLHQATGVTRLDEFEGIILYHLDFSDNYAGEQNDFGEYHNNIRKVEKSGSDQDIFNAHFDLGLVLMTTAQWEPALVQLDLSRVLAFAKPDICTVTDWDFLLVNIAFCHLNLDQPAAGIKILGENLLNLTPITDSYHSGLRHFVLGRLLAELDRSAEARIHYELAYSAYSDAGQDNAMEEVLLYLNHLSQ